MLFIISTRDNPIVWDNSSNISNDQNTNPPSKIHHDVSNIKIRRRNENAHVVIENKPNIVNVTSKDV